MPGIKQELSYLMLGRQGGKNRIKILDHLKERSYNLNQLSKELGLNYRTIKHHIDILSDYNMIESSGGDYGKVYFLSPKLEQNYEILEEIKSKLQTVYSSPKLYEKLVEQTCEGIILLDENKEVIFLNKSAKEITGYEEDILGKNIENLLEGDISQKIEKVLVQNEFLEETMKIETEYEETKRVVITIDCFHFNGEDHKGFSLMMRDITKERKQKEILDALMNHSEVIIAYIDPNFDLIYVNSAYAEKTEYSPEELVGKNHFDLFPKEEDKKIFQEVIDIGETMSIKDRHLLEPKSSDYERVSCSLEPVKENGKVKGLVLSLYEM